MPKSKKGKPSRKSSGRTRSYPPGASTSGSRRPPNIPVDDLTGPIPPHAVLVEDIETLRGSNAYPYIRGFIQHLQAIGVIPSSADERTSTEVRCPTPEDMPGSPASSDSSADIGRMRTVSGKRRALSDSDSSSEASSIRPARKRACVALSSSEDERSSSPEPAVQAPVQPLDLPFQCHRCDRRFTSKRGRTSHLRFCGKQTVRGPTPAAEERKAKKDRLSQKYRNECTGCKSKFRTPAGLLTHRSMYCNAQEQEAVAMEKSVWRCGCGKYFDSKVGVTCHQTFHCGHVSYVKMAVD